MSITSEQLIESLRQLGNAQAVADMAKFGIKPAQALGISIPASRKLARTIGRNQALAVALWDSGCRMSRE